MNMPFNPPALDAATFQNLVVSDEFVIQGDLVYFSLVHPKTSDIYVAAVVSANHCTNSLIWNVTQNPENDTEIKFDSLAVDLDSRPRIEDFSDVAAVITQPFALNATQIDRLNLLLSEHFEEIKIKELRG